MATIGQRLKHARNERSLTVEDVAFHTRIPAARVRDMENDDLSRFANLTYARGFLKIYSEYLQLDLGDYLGHFRTEDFAHASGHEYIQTASATQNLPPAAVFRDKGRSARLPGLYLLVVAMITAGGIIWWNNRSKGEGEPNSAFTQSGGRPSGVAVDDVEMPAPAPSVPDHPQPAPAPEPSTPPQVAATIPSPLLVQPPARTESQRPVTAPSPESPPKAKVVDEEEP